MKKIITVCFIVVYNLITAQHNKFNHKKYVTDELENAKEIAYKQYLKDYVIKR